MRPCLSEQFPHHARGGLYCAYIRLRPPAGPKNSGAIFDRQHRRLVEPVSRRQDRQIKTNDV